MKIKRTAWLLCVCILMMYFCPMIATADSEIAGNVNFSIESYKIPQLQFDRSQEKIVVDKALSPQEKTTLMRAASGTERVSGEDTVYSIPQGSIIHHSADGITTVFDKNGIQVLRAEDRSAGLVATPKGSMPATMVHELPSGSVLHPASNITFVTVNDKVILVEINDNAKNTGETLITPTTPGSPQALIKSESMSASSQDPVPLSERTLVERVLIDYRPSDYDHHLNKSIMQLAVPKAPTADSSLVQYIEYQRGAYDVTYGDPFQSSHLYFAPTLEYNRYPDTWDMATWILNSDVSKPSYYTPGITVQTGDLLTGEVDSIYYFHPETSDPWDDFEYWKVDIHNLHGDTQKLSIIGDNKEYITNMDAVPLDIKIEAYGDPWATSEENFVGDTNISNISFSSQKDLPIDGSSLWVWGKYVNSGLNGQPGFMDMKIEENWPNSIVFRTRGGQSQKIEKTFSITNTMYDKKSSTAASEAIISAIESKLQNDPYREHWKEVFKVEGPDVSPGYFGGDSSLPSKSLNDATLHYHIGHGSFIGQITKDNSSLVLLKNTETNGNYDNEYFNAQDVKNKWGGKNKWVVLQTCNLLRDKKWIGAMGTTHGVFGFANVSDNVDSLPGAFLDNALGGKTLYKSWREATTNSLYKVKVPIGVDEHGLYGRGNITAVVYFKNPTQMMKDHFPDGEIAPDDPDDSRIYIVAWDCGSNNEVIL